jgi:hypothetical protein
MSRRRFGCEFEFSASWEKVEDAAKSSIPSGRLEVDKDWCRSRENHKWILKTDSTTSAELTTPVCHDVDLPIVCRVARKLSDYGLYITRKDGFHVHISTMSNDPVKMMRAWMDYEEAILSMFPEHRRKSDYCLPYVEDGLRMNDVQAVELLNNHHAVMSHSKLRTFEFRICEGTLDHALVGAWVRFCMAFVDSASSYRVRGESQPLEELTKRLSVPHRDYLLFMERRDKFGRRRV